MKTAKTILILLLMTLITLASIDFGYRIGLKEGMKLPKPYQESIVHDTIINLGKHEPYSIVINWSSIYPKDSIILKSK